MTIPTEQASSHILTHSPYAFEKAGGQREPSYKAQESPFSTFHVTPGSAASLLQGTPAARPAAQQLGQLTQPVLSPRT